MKILGGKYKGRKIRTLKETELRPTSSLVREALFNILSHNNIFAGQNIFSEDKLFLEIFCGSSIITFDALSRGIKNAILVDYNPKLKQLFENNSKILQHGEQTNFILCDIQKKFPLADIKVELCFIDPPYKKNFIPAILENLIKYNCLNKEALIVIESDKRNDFTYSKEKYRLLLEKNYGKSQLTFLQHINP